MAPPLVPGGSLSSWTISADGSRVFYSASQVTPGRIEVFDVPLDGSQAARALSATLAPGRSSTTFVLSPDEAHVLYVADQDTDEKYELYSVPTDGSRVSTKLSGSIPANADVLSSDLRWTPDGTRVVYVRTGGVYSALADGSQPPVLLTTLSPSSWGRLVVTPDSSRALFQYGPLYSVPVDGSTPVQLLSNAQTYSVSSFEVTSDSKVVCNDRSDTMWGGEEASLDTLFHVPAEGSAPPLAILGPFLDNMWIGPGAFKLTPDATRAIYLTSKSQLYSVRVDGLEPGLLNSIPNSVLAFGVSPDGSTVVFWCRNGGQASLLGVPTDHSAGTSLLAGPVPFSWALAAPEVGTDRAVFKLSTPGLYSAPLDHSEPYVALNGPLVSGGDVVSFHISPDGRWTIYLADQDSDHVFEIYSAPIDGQRPARKLNAPLVTFGDVTLFRFVPGSDSIVYQGDQETDGVSELFMSRYKRFGPQTSRASPH